MMTGNQTSQDVIARSNFVLMESSKQKQFDHIQKLSAQLRFQGNETRTSVEHVIGVLLSRIDSMVGLAWLGERARDLIVLAVLIIHTTAPVAFLTKTAAGGIAPGAGLIWLAGGVLGIFLALLSPLRTAILGVKLLPFVALTGWIALSTTWSISPGESFRGAVFITASHLAAVAIAASYSWKRLLILLNIALGTMVTISVLLAALVPTLGQMQTVHPGAWSGLWLEKQFMGLYSCHFITAAIALAVIDRRFWPVLLLIPVGVAGLIGATGRTAMLMTAITVASMPLVWLFQQGPLRALLTSWFAVMTGAGFAVAAMAGFDTALRLLGRGADLTGRVEIWEQIRILIAERPMTGYGYQAIWRTSQEMTSPYQWIVGSADFTPANGHSSWLDAQLGLGLPGLVLLVVCVLYAWCLVLWRMRSGGAGSLFSVATLVALTSISFTESTFLNHMDLQWVLIVLIAGKALAGDPVPAAAGNDKLGRLQDDAYEYALISPDPGQGLPLGRSPSINGSWR